MADTGVHGTVDPSNDANNAGKSQQPPPAAPTNVLGPHFSTMGGGRNTDTKN